MAKILDQEGLKVLWAKIKEYAATSDDISKALGNYKTSTELTEILSSYVTEKDFEDKIDEITEAATKVFTYKGSVDTYAELPVSSDEITINVGDVWNVVNADAEHGINAGDNVVWTGDSWDNLSGIIDLSAYATKEYVNTEIAKKTTQEMTGTNGKALIFNESDGGGAKFEHNDGTESYVGVTDGGKDGMVAQIYADVEVDGNWVGSRLNVYQKGMLYHNAEDKAAEDYKADDPKHEVAIKKDIEKLESEIPAALTEEEINAICV
jgi:hypothetical protein